MNENWCTIKFGDAFKLSSGANLTVKKIIQGEYPVYGGNGIMGYHNAFNFSGDYIIIGRVGALCGNVRWVSGDFWLTDNAFRIEKYSVDFDKKYLEYYLNHLNLRQYAREAVHPVISNSSLKDILVTFPKKIGEQQQIVEKLDQAFELIDQAKANIEQNIINAKELFQSKLDDLFCATVGVEYKFKEVCNLVGGSQPSKENFIYEPREGYIRLVQVRDFRTDKFITYIPKEKASKFFTKDDIMIGRYGPPIFGIFKGLEGAYNVALMKAIPNHELVDDNYLYWYLQNKPLFNFVDKSSARAAGQSGIRKELLDEYPVFLSDIENQKKIVALITEIKNSTDSLIKSYQQKLDNLEELRKSILEKAFRGELTN